MTTNKPEVVAYLMQSKDIPDMRGVRLSVDSSCVDTRTTVEPLIRLSDHELVVSELRALLQRCEPVMVAHAGASHMTDGFRPRRNAWDELVERIEAALGGEA